jgi:hypothetical protein
MTPACFEAFETLKLRLISAPCLILPEINSDAMFTVATYVATLGTAGALLKDQGGGLQPFSYQARKQNLAKAWEHLLCARFRSFDRMRSA